MLKVHVIYQWHLASVNNRLLLPLDKLHKGKKLEISVFNVSQYQLKFVSMTDIIIFSNVIDRSALLIVEEAQQKGIRLLYDCSIGAEPDPADPEFLNKLMWESYKDLRAHDIRDQLLRMMDSVISRDSTIVLDHQHIKEYSTIIRDASPDVLYHVITSVSSSPKRQKKKIHGKKILFIAPTFMWPHQYISDILVKNLMNIGHSVHLFTPRPSTFHTEAKCRLNDFESRFIKQIIEHSEDTWKIPLIIDREEPDLVMTIQGYVIPRQVLMEINRRKVNFAVWFIDEPYDTSRSCSYGKYFTHVFLQDRSSLSYHRRCGNPNSFYLPIGCDPMGIHSQDIPTNGFKRDVALLGSPSRERIELVNSLHKRGIDVDVAGNGWSEMGKEMTRVMSPEDAKNYYRQTKININLHCCGDNYFNNSGQFKPISPNSSTFDIAGSNAFQLLDTDREEIREFFIPDTEIVQFYDIDECAEKIRYYLENEDKRKQLADAAFERACREHTYAHRIETMFRLIDENDMNLRHPGHYKVGYVQIGGELIHAVDRLHRESTLTLVQDKKSDIKVSNKVRLMMMSPEIGFSNAINSAIFETPSDFIVVSCSKPWQTHNMIEELIKEFSEDLYLGLILLRESKQHFTGFVMPIRVLMDAGIFRFGNANLSLIDMRYRLEDNGLTVKEICFNADSLEESIFDREATEEEKRRFLLDWTDSPKDRIDAQRILRLVLDNSWRLDKMEACDIVLKSLDICPGFLKGHEYLGKIFIREGNVRSAKEHLQYIYERTPEDITSALLYCSALYLTKEEEQAKAVLEAILNSDPKPFKNASAYYQKGIIQQKMKDSEGAVNSFIHALETDPAHTNSMKELALLYLEMGKDDEAISMMKARLSFFVNEETLNDVGVLYWMTGQKHEAYEWFVKALEYNPFCRSAVFNILTAGVELGCIQKIRDYIQGYLSYNPDDIELINFLRNIGKGRC